MSDISNRVGHHAENFLSEAQSTARTVAEAARGMGESAGEVAGGLRAMLDRSLERQPLTTVLVVAMAGLFLGGLLRR